MFYYIMCSVVSFGNCKFAKKKLKDPTDWKNCHFLEFEKDTWLWKVPEKARMDQKNSEKTATQREEKAVQKVGLHHIYELYKCHTLKINPKF